MACAAKGGKKTCRCRGKHGEADLFELPRRIKSEMQCCGQPPNPEAPYAKYLWIHIDEKTAQETGVTSDADAAPTIEQWLNVVDEAASLGVRWIVLSLSASLARFPEILEVCQWAQDAHDMTVGLHSHSSDLLVQEIGRLGTLDCSKTQVIAKREEMERLGALKQAGFELVAADPQTYGEKPDCEGPQHMLYINPQGKLFTCGLVEDRDEYALGNVFVRTFRELLSDPDLPHKVHPPDHTVTAGCDACPSLMARLLGVAPEDEA